MGAFFGHATAPVFLHPCLLPDYEHLQRRSQVDMLGQSACMCIEDLSGSHLSILSLKPTASSSPAMRVGWCIKSSPIPVEREVS